MNANIEQIINDILAVEGGEVTNDPSDSGGLTKWGWTAGALKAAGWPGAVQNLTRKEAFDLYYTHFVVKPHFDLILDVSEQIGAELVDTAVNMGPAVASVFLQRSLNAFNDGAKRYPDIAEDGIVGKATVRSLQQYLSWRGKEGENVLLVALNCLQGARYLDLCVKAPKNERFVYGWLRKRVVQT